MNLKNVLKYIKLREPGFRMLLSFVVVLILGQIIVIASQKSQSEGGIVSTIGDEVVGPTYTVRKGETLWKIAEDLLGSGFKWQEIANLNQISDPEVLEEGQKLTVPAPTAGLVQPTELDNPKNITSVSVEAKKYTVSQGDTLWSIAEREYGSGYNWIDLANSNTLQSPNRIESGQVLFLPNVKPRLQTVSTTPTDREEPISGTEYIVQKGDNLWKIAVRAYGDGYKWPEVAKINNLTNPGILFVNQSIRLPR